MEGFQHKNKYLRHLKKIAQVRQGIGKPTIFQPFSNIACSSPQIYLGNRQAVKTSANSRQIVQKRKLHTSTERIMTNFLVQRQNHRLVRKILHMNSSISFKKYTKEYQNVKKHMPNLEKTRKHSNKYIYFKFYEINLINIVKKDNLDQIYSVYRLQNKKKVRLYTSNLFQLRDKQFKIKKYEQAVFKIESNGEEGTITLDGNEIIDINQKGRKVGFVIIEYLRKGLF